MSASIVVAFDKNRVIGDRGQVPWKLSEDMKLFKERTLDKTVFMGRKTFESFADVPGLKKMPIPHLPDRKNVVITSRVSLFTDMYMEGQVEAAKRGEHIPVFFMTADDAFKMVMKMKPEDAFIIGGETIYKEALNRDCVERVWASFVPGEHEGDAFFPDLGLFWKEASRKACSGFTLIEYAKTI